MKIKRQVLKKIILEALQEECGMAHPPEPVATPTAPSSGHSMASQEGESYMARGTAWKAAESAKVVHELLNDDTDLPEWVEAKLTKAADYLNVVEDYISYKGVRGETPQTHAHPPAT